MLEVLLPAGVCNQVWCKWDKDNYLFVLFLWRSKMTREHNLCNIMKQAYEKSCKKVHVPFFMFNRENELSTKIENFKPDPREDHKGLSVRHTILRSGIVQQKNPEQCYNNRNQQHCFNTFTWEKKTKWCTKFNWCRRESSRVLFQQFSLLFVGCLLSCVLSTVSCLWCLKLWNVEIWHILLISWCTRGHANDLLIVSWAFRLLNTFWLFRNSINSLTTPDCFIYVPFTNKVSSMTLRIVMVVMTMTNA